MDALDEDARSSLDQGYVLVRVAERLVPLLLDRSVSLGDADGMPSEAVAPVCCACGTVGIVSAAVVAQGYDDDHVGYRDVWYTSRHADRCARCGAALQLELRYTHTTRLLNSSERLIVLDGVDAVSGSLWAPSVRPGSA